jgi:hypothetical protein
MQQQMQRQVLKSHYISLGRLKDLLTKKHGKAWDVSIKSDVIVVTAPGILSDPEVESLKRGKKDVFN